MARLASPPTIGYVERRLYRWYDHDCGRHAIPEDLTTGVLGETACGLEVTPDAGHTLGCFPTCPMCEDKWRAAEGLKSLNEINAAIKKAEQLPSPRGRR